MDINFGVDAICLPLTGIGRYAYELAKRLDIDSNFNARFYLNDNLVSLEGQRIRSLHSRLPSFARGLYLKNICGRRLFHGPNYFSPKWAECSVVTIHDLSVFKFPETHPIERLRQFDALFQDSTKRSKLLITDSEAVRHELIDYLGCDSRKVVTVPLGVGDQYRPISREEWYGTVCCQFNLSYGNYVLAVGTLEPRKNIDKLLLAYQCMPLSIRRAFPLVLVGAKGWAGSDFYLAIEKAASEGWVIPLGYVDEAHLPGLFAGAALFVFPSKYEGFGLPIIEAMACGVPVITSDIPVMREVSLEMAQYVSANDHEGYARTIMESLEQSSLRKFSIEYSETIRDIYSWDRCFAETCKIYRRFS